VLDIALFNNY